MLPVHLFTYSAFASLTRRTLQSLPSSRVTSYFVQVPAVYLAPKAGSLESTGTRSLMLDEGLHVGRPWLISIAARLGILVDPDQRVNIFTRCPMWNSIIRCLPRPRPRRPGLQTGTQPGKPTSGVTYSFVVCLVRYFPSTVDDNSQ
jgi:hypothetical protein